MKLARLFIFAALMVSIGGQWMALQGVAWLSMAVTYTVETGSVATGLSQTFDGEHPCPLCKAVQKGSQEERDSATPGSGGQSLAASKAELCSFELIRLFPPQGFLEAWVANHRKALARTFAPEGPPPRGIAA